MPILYHSTNNPAEIVSFKEAILNGLASNYGLYMMKRQDIPKLSNSQLSSMKNISYAEIAFEVLKPYVIPDINENDFIDILKNAYDENIIPVDIQHITGNSYIMWLSKGPTYSFKDFAARFFGRVLNYFLSNSGMKRTVIVATSGDTGGAVAHALYKLPSINNIVFFPGKAISEQQRRQMTTLQENIFAFSVNGDFDVCQEIAKSLLSDKEFVKDLTGDTDRFTSANSISLGRLLPQAVYPFFAYSRICTEDRDFIPSIPSGNFGDMMGTVIAREMGLPIKKIVIGVNENREFPEFLKSGEYIVKPSVWSPSTAMIVSHPSNFARLIEFYGGHIYDERDPVNKKIIKPGTIDKMPDIKAMRRDFYSISISNNEHYDTINKVYETYGIILDPHGSVGFKALEAYNNGKHEKYSVIYETADPGKFPEDIKKAIGIEPDVPDGIKKQRNMPERIFTIDSDPLIDEKGIKKMSDEQYREAKEKIKDTLKS